MNKFKRIFAVLVALAGIFMVGCKYDTETSGNNLSKAIVTFSLEGESSNSFRTAEPEISVSNFSSFVLTGAKEGEEASTLGTWNTTGSLTSASVELDFGKWTFTLVARTSGGIEYTSTVIKTLVAGTNNVVFSLQQSSWGTGEGNISVALSFPKAKVNTVTMTVYNYPAMTKVCEEDITEVTSGTPYDSVSYTKEDLPAGQYRVVAELFADAEKTISIGKYKEIFTVATGLTTSDSFTFDVLNGVNTITYVLNGGTISGNASEIYSASKSVTLPSITKDGYIFDGWYLNENFIGAAVTEISSANCSGDVTVYAKWIECPKINASVTIAARNDVALVKTQNGTKLTFTATEGYDSYVWECADSVTEETSNSFEFETAGKGNGYYNIYVIAQKDTSYYSATAGVNIETVAAGDTGVSVSSVSLNKNHVSTTSQTINVTVTGSGFENITDETPIKVQVLDSSNSIKETIIATVDAENNIATASFTSSTLTGTYKVRVKIGEEVVTKVTDTLLVTDNASISSVSLSTTEMALSDVTSATKVTATISGEELDIASTITIKLIDSTGTLYGEEISVTVPAAISATSVTKEFSVPTVDDMYSVEVYLNGSRATKTTLQVYDVPKFTAFNIPPVGIIAEDKKVTATVTGKNFTAPGVTAASFAVSCASKAYITNNAAVTVVNDSTLNVALTIPGTAGTYDVTITSGSNSQTGIFTVKDYSGIAAGDFIFKDGTTLSKDTELTADQKADVVAIAYFNTNGELLGLGLKQSDNLLWAPRETRGCETYFTDIAADSDKTGSGAACGATITGDTDGSDNWDYVKSIDSVGTAYAATNYPAFNYAANYGTNANLEGALATGWYMPSIAELCELYKNKDVLNASLEKVNGTQFRDKWYWSSSQSIDNGFAWDLCFSDGSLDDQSNKTNDEYVCCVRAF